MEYAAKYTIIIIIRFLLLAIKLRFSLILFSWELFYDIVTFYFIPILRIKSDSFSIESNDEDTTVLVTDKNDTLTLLGNQDIHFSLTNTYIDFFYCFLLSF